MSNILVVGAGVVGQATGFGLIDHGHDVTFVDVSEETVERLLSQNYQAVLVGDANLHNCDVVFVSVTALTNDSGIDLSHLLNATDALGHKLQGLDSGYPVIVYRCTMIPGTVRNLLAPRLEAASGKLAGESFGIVYNPEYLRAASAREDFLHPRIVTLASFEQDDRAHKTIYAIMSDFGTSMHWMPFEVAEYQKYVNNVGNAVKISTYNWFRTLGVRIGLEQGQIDKAFELSALSAEGLWNGSYGTKNFGPYDGACLPKDTKALRCFSESLGIDTSLLDSVQQVNRAYGGA
ncbi:2-dehydropantoate 2-reductase N-terminal domain-containing protein [Pseudarthrobacter oxydans]|uniref:2-dehydropantoate 2-reductase N-terminal domain-containing protein n=1 Tax=Pseudarthrobacter oxydans TaxID=1671 RepID=UPI003820B204